MMKKMIAIVLLACLSLAAEAQSKFDTGTLSTRYKIEKIIYND